MIYAIQCGDDGPVKIGFAKDPHRRIAELQTGCPERLTLLREVPGQRSDERRIHSTFSGTRISGEWFAKTQALMDFLSGLQESRDVEQDLGFRSVIRCWPTLADFAGDVGVSTECAAKWWQRNRVPAWRFRSLVAAARNRGLDGVSADVLADISAKRIRSTPANGDAA